MRRKFHITRFVFLLISFLISIRSFSQFTPDPGIPGPDSVITAYYDLGDLAYKPPSFPDMVEVRGSVHYPANLSDGPFPVLLFLHGRHETCYLTASPSNTSGDWPCVGGYQSITSFEGYDYLANLMASHGYIVISISCNAINATDNWVWDYGMAARGELVQHHLDLWNTFNTTGGDPFGTLFVGKLDMNNIGTMGHSRGGEGVVMNALLNKSLGSPYGINAVLTLAPVDFGREVLNDVAFMNVAPYCDGDVSDIQGVHYYDDARYPVIDDQTPKHSVLIMGANHNFFNTVWTPGEYIAGTSDDWTDWYGGGDPHCGSFADHKRLSAEDQQAAFAAYASAFFRYYLGHEMAFKPILDADDIIPPASTTLDPSEVFVSYQAPDSLKLDINNTLAESNETTNTLSGNVSENGLTDFQTCGGGVGEDDCNIGYSSEQEPHSAAFGYPGLSQQGLAWNDSTDWYQNELPPEYQDITGYSNLQFRAAIDFDDSPDGEDLDFTIQLIDSFGNKSSQLVSTYSNALFYQPGQTFYELPKVLFNTIKIPIRTFSGVDLHHIEKIRFLFNNSEEGYILITDLTLSGHPAAKINETEEYILAPVTDHSILPIGIYPNPAHNTIYVDLGEVNLNALSVSLYDMQGKLIDHRENLKSSLTVFDLKDKPNGIYILNAINNEGQGSYKFIKQ